MDAEDRAPSGGHGSTRSVRAPSARRVRCPDTAGGVDGNAQPRSPQSACHDKRAAPTVGSGWLASLAWSSHHFCGKKRHARAVRLLGSVFEGRPPVLYFDYDRNCGEPPRDARRVLTDEGLGSSGLAGVPKMYYCHDTSKEVHEYNAVKNTLGTAAVRRTGASTGRWALLWSAHPTPDLLRSFHPFQKTNHFPGSWSLGRKDSLSRNIYRMKRQWPQHFNIMPAGFVLPEDSQAWSAAREQHRTALWIWKPCNSSCGRGIRVFSGSAIPPALERRLSGRPGVVQRYLDQPLLINGFKFDLRLYVVVTSYDPLRVYLNSEGLVRLATERYDPTADSLGRRTMHLTNYSVNKHSDNYAKNLDGQGAASSSPPSGGGHGSGSASDEELEEEEGEFSGAEGAGPESGGGGAGQTSLSSSASSSASASSSKWSLEQLREHFAAIGLDYGAMMQRIRDLIIKTLIAAEPPIVLAWQQGANFTAFSGVQAPQIGPNQTCFETYGFDVMVDSKLKPWLLEVNILPSLSSSSPLDKRIKTKLIADVLTLVGFYPFDHDLVERAMRDEQAKRRQGLASKLATVARSHTVQSVGAAPLRDLGEAEWRLILDTHDEFMRRGALERIYPVRREEEPAYYAQFFPTPRYSNHVLARWLDAGGEDCFRPEARGELPPFVPRQVCFTAC